MAMLDAFFNKGAFKGAKCKTLLKLTIPRIKLLRNRREIQLKQMRRDIAKLLENGQEATARIRVEHIIREENMMAAHEIIELFCELIVVRLPIIETQRECPLDLKEAISSVCFAAPRCADLPELQQVQMLFAAKYGKEFVQAASELMPDCGVNRQVIELLSVRAPSVEAKLKLLKEIAEEHELDWDPADSESEFLKPHEDLLNGPSNFVSGSTLPLPSEKHNESLSSTTTAEEQELDDDTLDLPEVPKISVQTIPDTTSAPEYVPPPASSLTHDLSHEFTKRSTSNEDLLHMAEQPTAPIYNPSDSVPSKENRQFIPFVTSPVLSTGSFSEKASVPPSLSSKSVPTNQDQQRPSFSRTQTEINTDLNDVLAAAQTAAETAERAAAAARAAASLAQVRITELATRRNTRISESIENRNEEIGSDQQETLQRSDLHRQKSSGHINHAISDGLEWRSDSREQSPELHASHQYQRSGSLEDDPYFSYPNLFSSSQDHTLKSNTQQSPDNSRSTL
ncbi:IST1 homolog [Dioscorea cayenensis subsp. rotundata]|uniref:IST1 homolog n=1 Tax=Dioscorea cayennensis subsp. rotundata TaxID=55577 RepID=A0AB40AJG2_DIOCR|nr:IST1 homolog [Dioscorea cayenensis subsp. rotundata]